MQPLRVARALGSGLLVGLVGVLVSIPLFAVGWWVSQCSIITGSCSTGWRRTVGNGLEIAGVASLALAPVLLIGLTAYRVRRPL